ncbi:MAG: LicD family protein [Oscillospiraceae bacterium]|nr:LicD family protein [Oscillospiraceae bacterium]
MQELSLREIQMGEFGVLKTLISICEAQHLRCYLFYGTLLGAVRHQGFIPWDDDVDVIMPRQDYQALMEYLTAREAELRPLQLMSPYNNRDYIYPIARLCDTRYYVDYQGAQEYGLGLFVDIYPYDGYGATIEEAKANFRENQRLIQFISIAGSSKFVGSTRGALHTPLKFAAYCYARLKGAQYFIGKLEKKAAALSFEDNVYVGCSVWDNEDRWIFKREWFEKTVCLPFEGESFPAPAGYDAALRQCYGDYMQLPPEEDRIGHHYYTAYRKDDASSEI